MVFWWTDPLSRGTCGDGRSNICCRDVVVLLTANTETAGSSSAECLYSLSSLWQSAAPNQVLSIGGEKPRMRLCSATAPPLRIIGTLSKINPNICHSCLVSRNSLIAFNQHRSFCSVRSRYQHIWQSSVDLDLCCFGAALWLRTRDEFCQGISSQILLTSARRLRLGHR